MNRGTVIRYAMPNLGAILILALALTGRLGAAGSSTVLGQAPTTTTISYQGRLTNASGQPLTATLPMVFSLYTAPIGGTAVWSENRLETNAVPVTSGLFNVLLGSVTPINISLLNRDLWLGIAVNGDAEMTPREKLASVPYAAKAGTAARADYATRAGLAQTVPDGSITTAKLADGAITSDKLSPTVDMRIMPSLQSIRLGAAWTPVDIPDTNMSLTLTRSSKVIVSFDATIYSILKDQSVDVMLVVDGGNAFVASQMQSPVCNLGGSTILQLGPGSHTIKLMVQTGIANQDLGFEGGRTSIMYQVIGQ